MWRWNLRYKKSARENKANCLETVPIKNPDIATAMDHLVCASAQTSAGKTLTIHT